MVKTLNDILNAANALFKDDRDKKAAAGILIEEMLGVSRQDMLIHKDIEVSPQKEEALKKAFCELKEDRPLQYILGFWEFYGERFKVGEGVLIPREDTSAAVELALEFLKDKKDATFIDLGSGSGCIAAVLSKKLKISGTAVENSKEAFSYLSYNLKALGVSVEPVFGDMFSQETKDKLKKADLIISNPPYISEEEMLSLDENVKREPRAALCGGADGLYFYREISCQYKDKIKDGGAIVFEVGYNEADAVEEILIQNGFKNITHRRDINNIRRALCAEK